jgi:membrane-associated PAP2 superfamily phosphatase
MLLQRIEMRLKRRCFAFWVALFFVCVPAALPAGEQTKRADGDSTSIGEGNTDSLMFQLNPTPRPSELKWYTMFERIPGDWVTFANRNIREEKIPHILGITGLTAFAIWTDQPVWEASDRWFKTGGKFVQDMSDFGVYIGDGKPQFGLAAAFGAFGLLAKDDRALRTGSQLVQTILACGIVIQTLKHITGRESPFVSSRINGRWVFFPNQIEYHKKVPYYDAFPSGHIATTMATLTVVMENYPEWKPWLRPLTYGLVALVGIGLSNTGIHWWSDYPLGIALGYEFGMIAAHPEGFDLAKSDNDDSPKLTLSPDISPIRRGITVSLHF